MVLGTILFSILSFILLLFSMARKLRIQIPGFYHIVNRSVERRIVYSEPEDFEFFLSLLGKMKKLFTVNLHAFCLMSNHYHILLEAKEENLSKSIHFINDKYAGYFNKKYNRSVQIPIYPSNTSVTLLVYNFLAQKFNRREV